jgi:hypothetical protein
MFLSQLDLFSQAARQGDGWTLVNTTATTHAYKPIKL